MPKYQKLSVKEELMLHCAQVNYDYMRTPAGEVKGFEKVVSLYQRLALQSLLCAQAWYDHLEECPPHEPACSAFWWAVIPWAFSFGRDLGVESQEWYRVFVAPHVSFAFYLRRSMPAPTWRSGAKGPAEAILLNDIRWMELVIKLTARWGLVHHLGDWRALVQAVRLMEELRRRPSPAWRPSNFAYWAYLHSDIAFFRALFRPFPFRDSTRAQIETWLKEAERRDNGRAGGGPGIP